MNQDLLNRGIFDLPDDLVLCAEGVCPDKCLQLKYQGNITYWYYFQAKWDFRWVKTGLGALRKLGNRWWKSAGEQLMVGWAKFRMNNSRNWAKTGGKLVVGGGYCW
jgi:hypothetical protein